jgi:hypothetical protein
MRTESAGVRWITKTLVPSPVVVLVIRSAIGRVPSKCGAGSGWSGPGGGSYDYESWLMVIPVGVATTGGMIGTLSVALSGAVAPVGVNDEVQVRL